MLHLMGRESELDSFRHVRGGDERPQVQVAAREMLIRPKEIIFHQEGCQALEQVARLPVKSLSLQTLKTQQSKPILALLWARGWTRHPPEVSSNLDYYMILRIKQSSKYYVSQSLCFKKAKRKFLIHTTEVRCLPFTPAVLEGSRTERLVWGQWEVKEAGGNCQALETEELNETKN